MSDEWSLKGKRVWSYDDLEFEDGSDAYSGRYFKTREDVENNKLSKQYCYIEEDVDLLRKKLIEDIEGICGVIFTKEVYDVNVPTIKRIINKRFGVEEE